MKKINTVLILVMSIFLFACNNSNNANKKVEAESHEGHHHDGENEAIELNNGEKWKVDDQMLVAIRNMENDVNAVAIAEEKDYKSLAEKLKTNIDLLTSSCTMKGKSHDELHKWLLPYIDAVKELSKAKNEKEATEEFEKIENSLKVFNEYFK